MEVILPSSEQAPERGRGYDDTLMRVEAMGVAIVTILAPQKHVAGIIAVMNNDKRHRNYNLGARGHYS